jgi:phosphomannomutase
VTKKIKFGTDGWRAVIADEFTFKNVSMVSLAIGQYIYSNNSLKKKGIVIGYDNRFLSEEFAKQAGNILAGQGLKVYISKESIPTPVTAFMVREMKLDGAIMITASHNPPEYNGIKFIPYYGGPAEDDITKEIESNLDNILNKYNNKDLDLPSTGSNNNVYYISDFEGYKKKLMEVLNVDLIKKSNIKVAVDTMYGAGSKIMPEILNDYLGIDALFINNFRDPLFGEKLPDPSEKNLDNLKDKVISNNLDIGVALDGDADRFGVIDGKGIFISPNNVISMILYYLIEVGNYNPQDSVVRSIATTHLIDEIAIKNNIKVIEKPVGFKYIGKEMLNNNIIIGGEESGGLSVKGHIPEKDGLLADLLLIEIQSYLKKHRNNFYLSDYLKEIYKEFGTFYNTRLDIKIPESKKRKIINYFSSQKEKLINDKKVIDVNTMDGSKLLFEDKSWLLIRPSGTEPLIRCYTESTDKNYFIKLCDFIKNKINELVD